MSRFVVWFSCGAASAVAAKLAVEKYGEACEVVYCDTLASEHPDNARFLRDIEAWIGRPITVIRSDRYASVDDVFMKRRFMSGPGGAICTTEMKKLPRVAWQRETDTHIFGYTADEQRRADDFEENNPTLHVEWILIEAGLTKAACLWRLAMEGIALPKLYALGFEHNNCIGCVKATSPGYWNLVRKHFPDVFERRAQQSRTIGARLARVKNVRVFLDELAPDLYAPQDTVDCGPACQTPAARTPQGER